MNGIFFKILNMALTASWLIIAVAVVRMLIKKAPRWISCLLWALVLLRLVLPFSFESRLSLVPSVGTVGYETVTQSSGEVPSEGAAPFIVTVGGEQASAPAVSDPDAPEKNRNGDFLKALISAAPFVWVGGAALMLAYALFSYARLKRKVAASVPAGAGVMACDDIGSPFILGIIKPKIYVPSSMSGRPLELVTEHEKAHIKRLDHLWKPLGYLALTVYWLDPLCWLAYILFCRDIEAACDEKVVRDMDKEGVAEYSRTLLDFSAPKKTVSACPLAFGEVGVKQRIKRILNYKKPAFWIIAAAILLCAAVAVCFLTDKKNSEKVVCGKIVGIQAGALLIEPEEDGKKNLDHGTVRVPADGTVIGEAGIGDRVEIKYNGETVYTIKITEKAADPVTQEPATEDPGTQDPSSQGIVLQEPVTQEPVSGGDTDKKYLFAPEEEYKGRSLEELRQTFPGFFGLPTEKGLDIYVWQMAPRAYYCSLVSGYDKKTDVQLEFGSGVIMQEMKLILSTYNVKESDVRVHAIRKAISSYFYVIDDEYLATVKGLLFPEKTVGYKVSYANWSNVLIMSSLNSDKMLISSEQHLPVFKFDSLGELESFKKAYGGSLTMDMGYDEMPSFKEATASYDDAFFENKSVVLVYVSSSSGSFRYGVTSVGLSGSDLSVGVYQSFDPEAYTANMAGWFITVELEKSDIKDCKSFDAVMVR